MYELVSTITSDGLKLAGLLTKGDTTKPAIIHIHGSEGDFYTNSFINPIAEKLTNQKNTFLTVQTRGTGSEYLFLKNGSWEKYGTHYELLNEAYKDIDAWIAFLSNKGYTSIILQGHSLGTIKVIRYLFEGSHKDKVKKLILLAPFDKNAIIEKVTHGKWKEYVSEGKQKIQEGKGMQLVPQNFDDTESPHSYQTYLSWYEDSDLSNMFNFSQKNYSFPILNNISIPVKILVGTKDEYFHWSNPENPQEAMDILLKVIPHSSGKLFENAHHDFHGFEEELASEIASFI